MLFRRVPSAFSSGQVVPQTGLYVALHPSGAVSYGKLAFDKGEAFPLCSRAMTCATHCSALCRWRVFHSKQA
jgi:hypothetical protein